MLCGCGGLGVLQTTSSFANRTGDGSLTLLSSSSCKTAISKSASTFRWSQSRNGFHLCSSKVLSALPTIARRRHASQDNQLCRMESRAPACADLLESWVSLCSGVAKVVDNFAVPINLRRNLRKPLQHNHSQCCIDTFQLFNPPLIWRKILPLFQPLNLRRLIHNRLALLGANRNVICNSGD